MTVLRFQTGGGGGGDIRYPRRVGGIRKNNLSDVPVQTSVYFQSTLSTDMLFIQGLEEIATHTNARAHQRVKISITRWTKKKTTVQM